MTDLRALRRRRRQRLTVVLPDRRTGRQINRELERKEPYQRELIQSRDFGGKITRSNDGKSMTDCTQDRCEEEKGEKEKESYSPVIQAKKEKEKRSHLSTELSTTEISNRAPHTVYC